MHTEQLSEQLSEYLSWLTDCHSFPTGQHSAATTSPGIHITLFPLIPVSFFYVWLTAVLVCSQFEYRLCGFLWDMFPCRQAPTRPLGRTLPTWAHRAISTSPAHPTPRDAAGQLADVGRTKRTPILPLPRHLLLHRLCQQFFRGNLYTSSTSGCTQIHNRSPRRHHRVRQHARCRQLRCLLKAPHPVCAKRGDESACKTFLSLCRPSLSRLTHQTCAPPVL